MSNGNGSAPAGVTFDFSKAQPIDASAPSGGAPAGVTFDFSKAQPIDQPQQKPEFRATQPPQDWGERLTRWADNVSNDIKYGTDITGVGTVLKKMGAHGVYNGNSKDVGDFMGSLPLGLLRSAKGVGELYHGQHPFQGAKDIAMGGVQAATIPSAFVAPEAAEVASEGVSQAVNKAGELGSAALDTAGRAATRARKPFSPAMAQRDLQASIRSHLDNAAQDAGLQARSTNPDGTPISMRRVARNMSDELQANAKDAARKIDTARDNAMNLRPEGTGRIADYTDQIGQVQKQLRADPENSGLIKKLNQLHDARDKALTEARTAPTPGRTRGGLTARKIDEADQLFKQQQGMEQLHHHLVGSTDGLEPELTKAGTKTQPETVNPQELFERTHHMSQDGTLDQTLGDHADNFQRDVNAAHLRAQQIQLNTKRAKAMMKFGLETGKWGGAAALARELFK